MKRSILLAASGLILAIQIPVVAQMSKPAGNSADNAMTRVFGTNLNFSATMEMRVKLSPSNNDISQSGKIYFAGGNSRTELDLTKMTSSHMPPHTAEQMKAVGMDQLVTITRNDTRKVYMIYPGLESYAQLTPDDAHSTNNSQIETTELGKEVLDGHPCVKYKYQIQDGVKPGEALTMTAWRATDLKNYPVKIELVSTGPQGTTTTTLHFLNINTQPPVANLFNPPAGYRVYNDLKSMIQTEMMKKMSHPSLNDMPPGQPAAAMPAGHP